MTKLLAQPLDPAGLAPRPISPRLRSQLAYFTNPGAVAGLGPGEYGFDPAEVARWLDDGVIYLVSPLDTDNMTEVELSEEQEDFLGWVHSQAVRHVRVVEV